MRFENIFSSAREEKGKKGVYKHHFKHADTVMEKNVMASCIINQGWELVNCKKEEI